MSSMEKESFSPETVAGNEKKATQVLSNGLEFAAQLRIMLSSQRLGDVDHTLCNMSAGDLVTKILDSFEKSLLILQRPSSISDEVSQVPVNSGAPMSEELDSSHTPKMVKDRRGCFKRRRTSEAETKVSSTPVDDGHAWRKYGQKSILNAKYPRHYYRCTHKFEQGCLATKQVQKTEEDPAPMYRTTYYGRHTCKNTYSDHTQFFNLDSIDQSDPSSKSILLNFQQNIPSLSSLNDNYRNHSTSSTRKFINKESGAMMNDNTNQSSSSLADYNFVSGRRTLATFGSSTTRTELLSPAGSDHGDVISSGVYSCSTSTSPDHTTAFEDQLDMMVAGVVNFDGGDDMAMDSFLL
ncbi:WRKY DNA-binding transcription factor 70 [Daucus carota subsp. sativus]|nr:PREDICTED: probable WRKY transcription factor 70 [Daucus carota subsp. sativus]